MLSTNIRITLLAIYLVLAGIQEADLIPLFEGKIQLADLWFLFIFFYVVFHYRKFLPVCHQLLQDNKLISFFLICLIYLIVNALSVFNSYSYPGMLELLGKIYLLLLSALTLLLLASLDHDYFLKSVFRIFYFFGISLALPGIVGWMLSVNGIHNATTEIYLNYPYLGDTHRLKSFATTPSMFISMITPCIVFGICNYLFYNKNTYALVSSTFFTLAALLSFTKSIVFILAACVILACYKFYKKTSIICGVFTLAVFVHFFFTHFLIIPSEQISDPGFTRGPYTSNEVLYTQAEISIVGSGYYSFKKTAWSMFLENPLLGVGPGNYNDKIIQLKESGNYPENLPAYDPHSAYLGALAETGCPGFISLLALGIFLLWLLVKMEFRQNAFSFSLLLIFFIIIAEGISMDIMNFRQYWLYFAIILAYSLKLSNGIKSKR